MVRDLPDIHRDPFDRLLVARALSEPLRLLTADGHLSKYMDLVVTVEKNGNGVMGRESMVFSATASSGWRAQNSRRSFANASRPLIRNAPDETDAYR
jgi:hypothetical protein